MSNLEINLLLLISFALNCFHHKLIEDYQGIKAVRVSNEKQQIFHWYFRVLVKWYHDRFLIFFEVELVRLLVLNLDKGIYYWFDEECQFMHFFCQWFRLIIFLFVFSRFDLQPLGWRDPGLFLFHLNNKNYTSFIVHVLSN